MPLLAKAGERVINTLPEWQVIVIGLGVVFVGLICIVLLCTLMSLIIRAVTPVKPAAPRSAPAQEEIPNRQQFVAAVSAVIAEEMGADVSRLRIKSIKKI